MQQPKRTKYRKFQKKVDKGVAWRGNRVNFGEYGLQALEYGWITNRQIESARVALTRHIKRRGKVWIRIFADKSYTKKPAEVRMGKGKGSPEGWAAVVRPGTVMYEMEGVPTWLAKEAFTRAMHKLPIKTRFVERGVEYEVQ